MTTGFLTRIYLVGILCCFLGSNLKVYAAVTETGKKIEKSLIEQDIKIANKIDEFASDIDTAMSGSNSAGRNRTNIVLRNQLNWAEGGTFTYTPHIDLNLRLPNLEKKWQLKFTTYDADEVDRGINRGRVKTTPIAENYGGSVGLLQKLGRITTEFQPRVEIKNPVTLSYLLKFRTNIEEKILTFKPELQLFARSDSGVGQFTSFNFDIPLYKTLALTLINEEQYQDRANIFSTNEGLSFGFSYNDYMTQSLSLMYESSSRPNFHLDRYIIASGFTHKIYKNVLHYTVVPYLAFPRNLDFKGSPGVNFELDIIF